VPDALAASDPPFFQRIGSRSLWRIAATSRALHVVLLALPVAIVVAATASLTRPFWVYQAYDEQVHYMIVVMVAHSWPHPVLTGYGSWSGPLVYWLLAGLSRPFGTTLASGRVVEAVMSWLTCVTAYVVFRDRLGARAWVALALSFMVGLSPFFFGQSFRLLTDNPTWLFVLLALERLLAYLQDPRTGRFAAFAAFAAVATLMRQTSVWLFLPGLLAPYCVHVSTRARVWAAALAVAGVAPLAALVVYWGGLLPTGGVQTDPGVFRLRDVCLSLAVIGLWGLLLVPADDAQTLFERLRFKGRAAVVAAAVLGLLAVAGGVMASLLGGDPYGMGLLSRVGQAWWRVLGTSLAWWIFVPLGAATLTALVITHWRRSVDRILVVALAAITLSTAASTTWYERYVDFAVLFLLGGLVASGSARVRGVDILRWVGVVAISVLWTVKLARA
jgi:Dolichyl-phosphate-mannose-protein mannosyltransferase